MTALPTFPKLPSQGGLDAPAWVALEKIHGAQLVIEATAAAVRFAKRKAWLGDDEPFFGWQLLRAPLVALAGAARARVGAPRLVLYGELYGGAYPHPAVPDLGLAPVQTGIWYAPDLRWNVFELRVMGDGRDEFLGFTEASALAAAVGLELPPVLGRGRRTELEALSERFPTRVPASLGLPALGPANLAEGLVLKPDRTMPAERYTAVKRKIAEMREDRFDGSAPWDPDRPVDRARLTAWAVRLTNGPRLASAASKVGRHDPRALVDEVVLDVLADLEAAFPGALRGLSTAELTELEGAIRGACPGA